MNWMLYSLVKGRDGRRASEFSVASVSVDENWEVVIDCPNRQLFGQLRQHFSAPLKVRYAIGQESGVFAYGWKDADVHSEEYVREALRRLYRLELVAREAKNE